MLQYFATPSFELFNDNLKAQLCASCMAASWNVLNGEDTDGIGMEYCLISTTVSYPQLENINTNESYPWKRVATASMTKGVKIESFEGKLWEGDPHFCDLLV